jgi:hypothetical protein
MKSTSCTSSPSPSAEALRLGVLEAPSCQHIRYALGTQYVPTIPRTILISQRLVNAIR